MRLECSTPGLKKLAKHLLGIEHFVKRTAKTFMRALGKAERDAQVEAIQGQHDLNGSPLRPISAKWRDWKIAHGFSGLILNQKGWIADGEHWNVVVVARRAGFIESIIWPRNCIRLLGWLARMGYGTSFGIPDEIREAFQQGVLSIGQEALELFDRKSMKLVGLGRRGRVRRRRAY